MSGFDDDPIEMNEFAGHGAPGAGDETQPVSLLRPEEDGTLLTQFVAELRALGDGPAPAPSAELEAVFNGATSLTAARAGRSRSVRRRAVVGAVAVSVLALGGTAAANDQLPQPAQSVVSHVVNVLTPFHVDPSKPPAHHGPGDGPGSTVPGVSAPGDGGSGTEPSESRGGSDSSGGGDRSGGTDGSGTAGGSGSDDGATSGGSGDGSGSGSGSGSGGSDDGSRTGSTSGTSGGGSDDHASTSPAPTTSPSRDGSGSGSSGGSDGGSSSGSGSGGSRSGTDG